MQMRVPKNTISYLEKPFLQIGKEIKPLSLLTNKDVYKVFSKSHLVEPVVKASLSAKYDIKTEEWSAIFCLSFNSVMETSI